MELLGSFLWSLCGIPQLIPPLHHAIFDKLNNVILQVIQAIILHIPCQRLFQTPWLFVMTESAARCRQTQFLFVILLRYVHIYVMLHNVIVICYVYTQINCRGATPNFLASLLFNFFRFNLHSTRIFTWEEELPNKHVLVFAFNLLIRTGSRMISKSVFRDLEIRCSQSAVWGKSTWICCLIIKKRLKLSSLRLWEALV